MKNIHYYFVLILALVSSSGQIHAVTRTASISGTWGTAGNWTPSGAPAAGDSIIIPSGKTMNIAANSSTGSVYVAAGGTVTFTAGTTLTLSQSLTVNGTFTMNTSNVSFAAGKSFTLGAGSMFTWNPNTNTVAGATLFTNGVENFATTSTLIIKKWYDYTVPIGTVVTGNFGNLTLNSLNGLSINEWRQQNQFATHQIIGTLTVDQGWIVLDKSGAISNTTIGNIVLLNVNSYLDLHGGTHPGSFTVNTTNLTITDGDMTGIYNGNGNVTLNVSGNVTLNGSGALLALILNSGVANVGNGNSTLNVTGNFIQNNGQFFGIYNISTYAAGVSTMTVSGNLTFLAGTFMAHYGCHTGTGTTTLTVTGNTSITYSNASDLFWIVGLTTLSVTDNTIKLNWKNTGAVSYAGNNTANFTSSGSKGAETDSLMSSVTVTGGSNCFNWPGGTAQSHATTIYIAGTTSVIGGDLTLSYMGAALTSQIDGSLNITGGSVNVKRESGAATLVLNGNYFQSAGSFNLHNKSATYTPNAIAVNVNGNFTQSGGTISYDNATSASSAQHTITLNGASYTLSGNGSITRTDAAANTVYGMLYFNRPGTITMSRTGSTHLITQVKQTVKNGCTLNVATGNLQISNHSVAGTTYLTVNSGGILNMNTNRIVPGGTGTQSGLQVDANGTLRTMNTFGLYDNTTSACIDPSNNMNFLLDANSIVEYNGVDNQVVTGIGVGTATGDNQKYGILRINFQGTPNSEYTYLNGATAVSARTQLELKDGELYLNGNTFSLENGASSGVTRNNGYVKSETNAAVNTGIFKWKSMTTGSHEFPFGYDASSYIPVTFDLSAGAGTDVEASTRATDAADNLPWAGNCNVSAVSNMSGSTSGDQSVSSVIDRWWNFVAPGVTATVTLSYRGIENTLIAALQTGSMMAQAWDGAEWLAPQGSGVGVTSGIGTVTVNAADFFSPWVIVAASTPLPIELIFFKAILNGEKVNLSWATAAEINNDFFTIERSSDGENFLVLSTQPGAGNSTQTLNYLSEDKNPLKGYNYYRLKQTDYDGKYTYSNIETVKYKSNGMNDAGLVITSAGPNPFSDKFTVNFTLKKETDINFTLTNSNGQTVAQDVIHTQDGMNTYEFVDKNGIEKGIYFVNLIYLDQKVTHKLIKN